MKTMVKALLLLALCFSASSWSAEVKLRLGHVGPPGSLYDKVTTSFASKVKAVSGGAMEVEVLGGGVLGAQPQLLSQVRTGALDFYVIDTSGISMAKEARDLQVLLAPYLFRDQAHFRKFVASPLFEEMMGKAGKEIGVKHLGLLSDNFPRALSANKPVRTLADLKGLKVRVPELPAFIAVWKGWGASPTPVKATDLFQSLQTGLVDGQENGINVVIELSLHEVQKYYMPIDYVHSALSLFASQATLSKLSPQQQGWLAKAAAEVDQEFKTVYPKYEAELYAKAKTGLQIIAPEIAGFRSAALEELKSGKFWPQELMQRIHDIR